MAMDVLDETDWAACGCLDAKRARDHEIKAEMKRVEKAAKDAAKKAKEDREAAIKLAEEKEDTPASNGSSSEEESMPVEEEDDDDDGTATIVGDPQTLRGLSRGIKRARSEEGDVPQQPVDRSEEREGQAKAGE